MKPINKFFGVLVAAALLGACKKELLTPVPTNLVSDLSAFSSALRIEGQVRSIYATIKDAGLYGGRYQIFHDIRGNDFINERTNVVTGFDVYNYTPSNSSANSVEAVWSRAYYAINLVNVFLEGMDAGGAAVVGETRANNFRAEARFVRALCYHALITLYARPFWDGNGSRDGVPLRLTAIKGAQNYDIARNTVAEVYNQILADLNFAEQNLPATNGNATLNTTRAHRNTAIAFKVRVLLGMGRYADVVTEANKIVSANAPFTASSGVPHALNPAFGTAFTNYTTNESILSMPFFSNEAPGTQNQLGFYYRSAAMAGGGAEYSVNPDGVFANAGWKATDARRAQIVTEGTKRWLNKYTTPAPYIDWAPVLRYPEVLLSLAEAITRSTNTVNDRAIALLNAVRGRSDNTTVFTAAD
ncbi:MAG TPA: RagB/SusD family nutrient uptake outer membrane protein, partial [Phnomibacter sp.]|nr:RagB/SusD family nutrient uptake outer membrane protein [Phnomibacter sp.]